MNDETIDIDVLVRGDHGPLEPPTPARIEEVRSWFAEAGIRGEPAPFGLACRASRTRLNSVLGPSDDLEDDWPVPPELDQLVSQITTMRPPTLFGDRGPR